MRLLTGKNESHFKIHFLKETYPFVYFKNEFDSPENAERRKDGQAWNFWESVMYRSWYKKRRQKGREKVFKEP